MDGVTLDGIIDELRPRVQGRHVRRAQALANALVFLELTSERGAGLALCAERGRACLCWLERDAARRFREEGETSGRTRHALLLLRKALEGARVLALTRIPGERSVMLSTAGGTLVLRFSGPAPSLTLGAGERAAAVVGDGPAAWPPPDPRPEREWHALDGEAFARAVEEARRAGRTLRRAVLAACPSLGPGLARRIDGTAEGFIRLQERLRHARPILVLPRPAEDLHDADLAAHDAVELLPLGWGDVEPSVAFDSWNEASARWLHLRTRGRRFEAHHRALLARERRHIERAERLAENLERDQKALPDPEELRAQAEALLSSDPTRWAEWVGSERALPRDARDPARVHEITMEPGVSVPAQADRLYGRARRVEAARQHIAGRITGTRAEIASALERERQLLSARDEADLPTVLPGPRLAHAPFDKSGPRRYLTSRGLEMVVGRGARENHEVTFSLARADDVWLHARDRPGAHVILRDPEGRASTRDEQEAAELAAFFSDGVGEAAVDVHVTRRKFVLPVRGTPGRVRIAHSEVRRVAPRNPEGRLRRRK